jgi:hypothetical protein
MTNPELMNDDQWRGYVTSQLQTALSELQALKAIVCKFEERLFSLKLKLAATSGAVSLAVTILVLLLGKHL